MELGRTWGVWDGFGVLLGANADDHHEQRAAMDRSNLPVFLSGKSDSYLSMEEGGWGIL